MHRLADIQADFAAALVDPALPRSRRFDVYRNNMTVSLIEALEAAFPAVHRLVGDEFFKASARSYIRCEPPRSPVLLLYGESFGDFLDGFPPVAGVPYLGDVARLEWARLRAYHAADAEPLAIGALTALPEASLPQTRFDLHPSLQLLRSRSPVASLWAVTAGGAPDTEVDMARGEAVAILRPTLRVDMRVLPSGGYAFLERLSSGATLGETAEQTARAYSDFDLAAHLQGLFQLGAVTAVHAPDSQGT